MSVIPVFRHQPAKPCRVYAHRGANREAMENTRDAFDRALYYAIDGIETDVQLTRDEVAVLWHDRFLNKIGYPDRRIDDFDYTQLQALVPPCGGETIMTLSDFLARYRERCQLLVEIKNRDWESIERHRIKMRLTLDLIGTNSDRYIAVSSFNLNSLCYAHQYRPGFPLIYNVEPDQTVDDVRALLATHGFLHGFCLPIANTDQAIVELLQRHGKCVGVYTCNSDAEINHALRSGVDILISDVPDQALRLRDR